MAANGHYPGRNDLYLLVLDPERIPVEVRWEESEPPMRFPHAYGPVPTAAVLDVSPTGRTRTASSPRRRSRRWTPRPAPPA